MANSPETTAILLAFSWAVAAAGTITSEPHFAPPVPASALAEPRNREASGLAASRRTPNLLWTHNDSGGEPVLYAIDAHTGDLRGKVRLKGVRNIDWEDIASFERDGKAWLVVGDIGDNFARRPFVLLHVLEEPAATALAPDRETEGAPAYTLRVVYEDLARDCESLAVDAREGMIYLLSKREQVPRLYRLPLEPNRETVVARRVGTVPHLPQPEFIQRLLKTPTGAYRGCPTAMDFLPDGSAALVLTYGDLLLFPRAADESWSDALAKPPVVLAPHKLPQAEGACFAADGRAIFVSSENTMTLLRYDRR